MTREQIKARIREIGVIPVVRASSSLQAIAAVDAIRAGGVPVVEITMTVPGAIDVIREVAQLYGPEVLVGAGTVLDGETAVRCIEAGAQFIVSPIFTPELISSAHEYAKVVLPGALTPTEVVAAWRSGADFVKVFPCGNVGGAKYVKALKAPLPQVEIVPTGGVNLQTARDFLQAGSAALGVGAELVDPAALANGAYDVITVNARKFAEIVTEFRKAQTSSGVSVSR